MSAVVRALFVFAGALALVAALARPASADVGDGGDAGDAAIEDAGGAEPAADAGEAPLACGGALCDTSNESSCAMGRGVRSGGAAVAALGIFAFAFARRRRRRATGVLALFVALGFARTAHAEPKAQESSVDVHVADPRPPSRPLSLEWNPLGLFTIGRASANVVLVPVDHHALVLSPFYAWTKTEPIAVQDANGNPIRVLPQQRFEGFGAELGYRWYSGLAGPRGFFLGPSLILGSFTAKAQDGTETSYLQIGGAADIGYQALLGDCVSLSLGAGVQYTTPNKTIPDQQFPSNLYANALVRPRVLASIGWAL